MAHLRRLLVTFGLLNNFATCFIPMENTFCSHSLQTGIPQEKFGDSSLPNILVFLKDVHDRKKEPEHQANSAKATEVIPGFWLNWKEAEKIISHYSKVKGVPIMDCILRNRTCESIKEEALQDVSPIFQLYGRDKAAPNSNYFKYWFDKEVKPKYSKCQHCLCFLICTELLIKKKYPMSLYFNYCPNPCASQPCKKIKNTVPGCRVTGMMDYNYECSCVSGYEWRWDSKSCQGTDPCRSLVEQEYPCYRRGTTYCHYNRDRKIASCYCNAGFMGKKCEKTFDACKTKSTDAQLLKNIVEGDLACNVNSGNQCVFDRHVGTYRCICGDKWQQDPSYNFDNCLLKLTQCDKIICLHGTCERSYDGKKAFCKCKPGYSGKSCTAWSGEWSPWSLWDRCRPACGLHRYTVRTRKCLSEMSTEHFGRRDCIGSFQEYQRCDKHECAPEKEDIVNQIFSMRNLALYFAILCNVLMAFFIVLGWRLVLSGLLHRSFMRIYRDADGT